MKNDQLLLAIDIGTTKVCTIVGLSQNTGLEILGVGSHPSYGLKKGSVVNIDKTVKSIHASVEEAKLMAGLNDLGPATIGIAGNHIYCFNSTGAVAIKNKEISQDDVDRVLEAAKAVVIPSDREILHVIAQEYRVDNTTGIKNPIGMVGVRLEVHVHIVTGMTPLIQNLTKCVEQAGIIPENIVLQPIASSKSVLSEEERETGVALVDIGGGTTDIAVWHEGSLIHSQIVPVGGNHFTNDLAVAMKVPHNEAERVKVNHGSVFFNEKNKNSHITVQGMSGTRPREICLEEVANVLRARAEELFKVVRQITGDHDLNDKISAGYVITGGGALIGNMAELAEHILGRSVKVGYPIPFGGMTNVMQDPKFSTVLGLLIEEREMKGFGNERKIRKNNRDFIRMFSDSIKSVFKEMF